VDRQRAFGTERPVSLDRPIGDDGSSALGELIADERTVAVRVRLGGRVPRRRAQAAGHAQ
jgi:DNA-directed RNA polymerase sigma subunit (sigma70/sigma32)